MQARVEFVLLDEHTRAEEEEAEVPLQQRKDVKAVAQIWLRYRYAHVRARGLSVTRRAASLKSEATKARTTFPFAHDGTKSIHPWRALCLASPTTPTTEGRIKH